MARLWQCGFELNSTSTGMEITATSGTLSLQTGTVRTGTYALRSNPTTATGFVRWHAFATDQAIVGYQRFYLNIASLPTASTTICRFLDASNNSVGAIRLSTTGTLQLLQAGGTQIGSSSTTLSTGTWYRVELKTDATGSGTLEGQLDGSSFASGANSAQGNWSRALIGVVGTNATTDLFFDDWAINDASGSAQTSWPGAGKILHLSPNGDGDNHAWSNTANGAGSSTNYQLVDEIPPNDTTDLVQTVTANAEDMYALTDSGIGSGDTVNVVMVGLRLRNNTTDATTAAKAQIKKTSGGTITQGSAIVPNTTTFFTNGNAEPRNYSLITYLDPDGAAWTQATLDTAQAGVKLTTAGTNRIQVSALWVSVDYTPVSSTPITDSDTGSGAEASTLATALSSADTGAGTEASSLTATASSADTGTGAEAASLVVQVSDADTGAGTEASSLTASLTSSETGTGGDAGTVDDGSSNNQNVSSSDTGQGADTATLAATLTSGDTGTAVETATIAVALTSADTATTADTATLAAQLTTADTAISADTGSLAVTLTALETASAVEAAALIAALTAADTGSAQEAADSGHSAAQDITIRVGRPTTAWTAAQPARDWAAGPPTV